MLPEFLQNYIRSVKHVILHPIATLRFIFKEVRHTGPVIFLINLCLLAFIFWVSLILSIVLYTVLYRGLIPSAMQSEALTFINSTNGSKARIFNPQAQFPLCTHGGDDSSRWKKYEKLCVTSNSSSFSFTSETYNVNLKLIVAPISEHQNHKRFGVQTELINKANLSIIHETNGTYEDPISQTFFPIRILYKAIRMFILWDSDVTMELNLIENFDNNLFDINAIEIRLQDREIKLKRAYLTVEPQLGGVRYLMAHWFWTVAFLFVCNLTPTFFVLIAGYLILKKRQKSKEKAKKN